MIGDYIFLENVSKSLCVEGFLCRLKMQLQEMGLTSLDPRAYSGNYNIIVVTLLMLTYFPIVIEIG